MRTHYGWLGLGLFLAATSPALAENHFYLGPYALIGFTNQNDYSRTPVTALPVDGDTDTMGVNGGAGLWGGYDFGAWSLELSGTYRARHDANFAFTDITSGLGLAAKSNVQTADLLVSTLYDLPVDWAVIPYIGAGAGVALHHLETELLTATTTDAGKNSDWQFAWQLQGGLKYPLSEGTLLRVDYRYIDLGKITTNALPTATNDRLSTDLTSHDLRIGMSWEF